MVNIFQLLKAGKVLVSDGAWGTELQNKGLKPGDCPELWNLEHPGAVLEVAKGYVDASSNIISTNSFGGNSFRLSEYKVEDKIHEINKAAAEISRVAAGDDVFVLASMGPSGKFLLMDDVAPDELEEAFGKQAIALKEGGANALLVETMTDFNEASIAVQAAIEATGLDVACTFTFEKTASGTWRTMMGQTVGACVHEARQAGAKIVGTNCGNGIQEMVELVTEIRAFDPDIPVIVQSNAGMPELIDGRIVYPESADFMAGKVKSLVDAGANIIGGCCGTTPEHIAAIVKEVG